MRQANLNLLPTLKALLATCSVSRTAELLHLSQPSISKQLAQLRQEFADELLVREGQRWLLTPRAEALRQELDEALEQLQSLYAPPQFNPTDCERVFRFASSDYVAQFILPAITAALAREAPRASLDFRLWQKELLPNLHQLDLDLVSTITESMPSGLTSRYQGEDGLVVLMRSDHPYLQEPLSRERYLAAWHVQVSGGGDKEGPVEQVLAPAQQQRRWFARVPFFQAAAGILRQTADNPGPHRLAAGSRGWSGPATTALCLCSSALSSDLAPAPSAGSGPSMVSRADFSILKSASAARGGRQRPAVSPATYR